MSAALTPSLNHPAYHTPVKMRGFNIAVTVFRLNLPRDTGRLLRMANPDWSHEDHVMLAQKHQLESDRLDQLHRELLDKAHLETFGRPREFADYRISGIGSDQYSDSMKHQLRFAAHAASHHRKLSLAHEAAGACRRKYLS
jgi:hypothetical protein